MRRALLVLSLAFVSIFIVGCDAIFDNGNVIFSQKVPSKLKVNIERLQTNAPNEQLTVYAMDFCKEGRTLTFVCPCYIPGSDDSFLNVRIEGDSFKLTLLPDAEYHVEVQYWAPKSDGNRKVEYKVSR